jgi:hypothetical protein
VIRHRAAVVEGAYVAWEDDLGPSKGRRHYVGSGNHPGCVRARRVRHPVASASHVVGDSGRASGPGLPDLSPFDIAVFEDDARFGAEATEHRRSRRRELIELNWERPEPLSGEVIAARILAQLDGCTCGGTLDTDGFTVWHAATCALLVGAVIR